MRKPLFEFLQGEILMPSKTLKSLALAAALLATAAGSISARAQGSSDEKEKPPIYTYVAQWDVARPDWPTFEKYDAAQKPVFEKLMADGTITGYGFFKLAAHSIDAPNHGSWWTATSMANLLKVLSLVGSQPIPADIEKIEAASKHFDLILVSRHYAAHAGSFDNGYLRVATYRSKPGQGEAVDKVINSYIVPMLDRLVADGSLHSYSVDREAIHSDDPSAVDIAIVTNNADGLDKFTAALEANGRANPTGGPAFGAATESSVHRDFLAVTSGASK
jgi:hypothetical protein